MGGNRYHRTNRSGNYENSSRRHRRSKIRPRGPATKKKLHIVRQPGNYSFNEYFGGVGKSNNTNNTNNESKADSEMANKDSSSECTNTYYEK